MKQLELTVKIEQVDNPDYPYELNVSLDGKPECSSWYRGKTVQEVLGAFCESFSDRNLKYWYLLKDKEV